MKMNHTSDFRENKAKQSQSFGIDYIA